MHPHDYSSGQIGPDPMSPFPIAGHKRVGFLKPLIRNPLIEVGDYSYYDDPEGPEHFEERNVLYHFDFLGDRLIIGKFCAIATGTRFIMNGANHDMRGFSSYPFGVMGGGWQEGFDLDGYREQSRGDTIIGDDVWIGREATILPGVAIGSGAIVAAGAIVSRDVPSYGMVAGNPAELIRLRFEEEIVDRLLALSWWDWSPELISKHREAIQGCNIEALQAATCALS
ncbi:CatB-related O-acetyltransferase [Cohaesibacter gelatinilyticus]|uniref:Virginiamycin A acetyltransferase n=1 Tax=Cohaesibacter gelatinilyticus TaxID=372072 RepID=A0A285PE54_9HYPH|nr:CatB-related O-acetyltransferase [Cohaesibacter gelatinilyticus]SNZ20015.1 virginiamycin A acetyltransferase [Cohaesibacter gelatinilyticus]